MKLKTIQLIIENILSPIFLLFSTTLILLEFFNGTNFVLNTFGIDYVDIFALSVGLAFIVLLRKGKLFIKDNWKKIVFIIPILLFLFSLIILMRYNHIFFYLEAEDSVIEWLQFLFITLILFLNFKLFSKYKAKDKLLAFIFLFAAIGFLFIAGEEISWGQRIFNIPTPEEYAKVNIQQELTIHNYGLIFGYVYRIYMIFGLLASTMFIFKPLLLRFIPRLKKVWNTFIPGWQYFIYFFTAFLYNYDRFFLRPDFRVVVWEEPMELLLFIGIFLFFLELFLRTKKSKK